MSLRPPRFKPATPRQRNQRRAISGRGNGARASLTFNLWCVADEELDGILQGRINYYTFIAGRSSLGVAAARSSPPFAW